jgi:hypothetical protein
MDGGERPRGAIVALALSPDGQAVAAVCLADKTVRVWEAKTGKLRRKFQTPRGATVASFSPDGRTVAFGCGDKALRLHDLADGEELHTMADLPANVTALAWSPDGRTLAFRGFDAPAIELFDVAARKRLRPVRFPAHVRPAAPDIVFSADGKAVAVPATWMEDRRAVDAVHVLDLKTGAEIRRVMLTREKPYLVNFRFSQDGRLLVTQNIDQSVSVWELASGKERAHLTKPGAAPLPTDEEMSAGSWSPRLAGLSAHLVWPRDGRFAAVVGATGAADFLAAETGQVLGRLPARAGYVRTAALTPDGKTLATGGIDGTVLVLDLGRLPGAPRPKVIDLTAGQTEALWSDLGEADAAKAFAAIKKLTAAPGQAVPLLGKRLRPAEPVGRWLPLLNDERFRVRQEATQELEKLGGAAVPALKKLLTEESSLEARRRVEQLLAKLQTLTLSAEPLRLVRAVEVLERLGTPEARELLTTLGRGADGALLTREAQAALTRLK